MAIINCKNCGGGVELSADKTFGTCECCGSTMTFPRVDDEQRAAAFNRGNHFRRIGEFDKALAVYERIVREDEKDAEAHWCCALCRFGIEYVEDPATYEWLPTCHRASFDPFQEDVDYKAALEYSDGVTRRQYVKDAAKIAEVQRGILATSQNAEPFDVFICYKESDENKQRTRDSLMAQDIYYQLTEQGRKVFFARITLEDVAGAQYEPYIFAALNSAKVMVVVGTKPEYLNAVWVKNEWSRFLAMMKKDRSKLLLPCYRDMDPYDLPEQLSVLQSYDMDKIGFIQDLTRGIAKVLDAEKKPVQQETVAAPQSNTAPLLRRAFMFLEDGNWASAEEYANKILDMNPECSEAYFCLAMCEVKVNSLESLVNAHNWMSSNYRRAKQFAAREVLDQIHDLEMALNAREKDRMEKERVRLEQKRLHEAEENAHIAAAKEQAAQREKAAQLAREKALQENLEKLAGLRKRAEKMRSLIFTGYACTAGIKADGTVVTTKYVGDSYHGQCEVSDWNDIVAIAGGGFHMVGLKSDGTVMSTKIIDSQGLDAGQCEVSGLGWKNISSIFAYTDRTIGLRADGTVAATRYAGRQEDNHGQCEVAGWRDIVSIAMGFYHTVGLRKDGRVVATKYTGDHYHNQCDVSEWADIVAIAANGYRTAGLKADGSVVLVGANVWTTDKYTVGTWRNVVAIAMTNDFLVGLKADGTVVSIGLHKQEISNWTDIVAITVGSNHVVGLKADGTVVAEHTFKDLKLYHGQCEVSDWKDIVAIAAYGNSTVGLKADGTLVATQVTDERYSDQGRSKVSGMRLFQNIDNLEQERKEQLEKRREEERIAREQRREEERIAKQRRDAGKCQHCGGSFKGLFVKKCASCGKQKDY